MSNITKLIPLKKPVLRIAYSIGLPKAIANKIYKTGQTRGADKDTIFQNRVLRNSTVLIPYQSWNNGILIPKENFENGYIVLIKPKDYFSDSPPKPKTEIPKNLVLGKNLLIFYETREEWNKYPPPLLRLKPASSRIVPLKGHYVARVPDTTRSGDSVIRHGFINSISGGQGAGIRVYEYASIATLEATRYQLAFLAWRTDGIFELSKSQGIPNPEECKKLVDQKCEGEGLADIKRLQTIRTLNKNGQTVCPLCQKVITASQLASLLVQAVGREVPDLTVTEANLFHVREVKTGEFNHCPYNLGWGHHHCNTVARDLGIDNSLKWMEEVLRANDKIR